MNIKGSKILVIGGAGLIGSYVVEELTKEDVREIIIYDNFSRGSKGNLKDALRDDRVRIYEAGGDICQIDILNSAMKGVDYVIHLAALWLLQCYEYPRSAFEVNIKGTFNVLEACVNNNIKKIIYSSSASVYGDALKLPITEDHPYNNRTFYGATKIAGEHMLRAFYERYQLNYVGLRYMNVYGPRQDYKGNYVAIIMKILDRLDKNLPPIIYGDGRQSYDFIYSKDCGEANICALKSNATDDFYNIGTGIKTSIKELTELLIELTGKKIDIKYEPEGLTFVKNRVACVKKAKEELGFEAKVKLKEGLIKLIKWRNEEKTE